MKRARMNFQRAECEKLTLYNTEKGYKTVVPITAPLTAECAELLQCAELFDSKGTPRENFTAHNLTSKLRDVDFVLPSGTSQDDWLTFRPEIVWKFKITREEGAGAFVSFLVHVMDKEYDLLAFHKKWGGGTFECGLISLQGHFDYTADDPGGTAVDMKTGEKVGERESEGPLFACDFCDKDVPLTEDGSGHIVDPDTGEIVECKRPSANAARRSKADGALASAADMGVRKQKKREPRKPVDVSEEEIEAGVTVQ